ncbi:MAG: MFS transporter [Microbacteriaceae bacterium]|nr:MFS transporter [Microbacteriaceae bacterium]
MTVRPASRPFPLVPLLTLAAATFMSVTIEMLPTGVMHLMAPDLGVRESQIGLLMSIFAFTVVITSTPLMVLLRRVPKRLLLVGVLAVFAVGTLGTALAPSYSLIVVTRIVTGVAHGVFWASVTAYTGMLVTREQLTKAVSISSGGGGLAFVLGVPLGTALGQLLGWRLAFGGLALACFATAALLWFVLPRGADREPEPDTSPIEVQPAPQALGGTEGLTAAPSLPPRPRRSLRMVVLTCILCAVVMTGQYSYYSYISPYLLGPAGLPEPWLPAVLFGYGIAAAVATATTGLVFSGRPRLGFYLTAAMMLLGGGAVLALPGGLALVVAGTVVWGASMGFMPVLLQSRLLAVAPSRQRDLASALYTSGFNLGIASGAYLGGLLLDDFGLVAPGVAFVVLIAAAVAMSAVIDVRVQQRMRRSV